MNLYFRADIGEVQQNDRIVTLTFSTGAGVLRRAYNGQPYLEVLSLKPGHVRLDRLNNSAPLLDSHAMDSLDHVLGVVVPGSAVVDGKIGTLRVRFAKPEDDERADRVYRKVVDKIIRNVSVGYRVHAFDVVKPAQDGAPAEWLAVDWEPFEVSLVTVGADEGAHVRRFGMARITDADRVRRLRLAWAQQSAYGGTWDGAA